MVHVLEQSDLLLIDPIKNYWKHCLYVLHEALNVRVVSKLVELVRLTDLQLSYAQHCKKENFNVG